MPISLVAPAPMASSIASELEGTLLISRSLFPYFLLVALEAGGPARAAILLTLCPLLSILGIVSYERLALPIAVFVSTAGLRVDNVKAVAKAALPRFFLENLRGAAFRVIVHCTGRKYVVTRLPRALVEPFLREYLGVDHVVGTELEVLGRRYSGRVAASASRSSGAVLGTPGDDHEEQLINVGLCSGIKDQHPFLMLCQERYVISSAEEGSSSPLPRAEYPQPLIFHDGRLVGRPDPLACIVILLWLPLGALLAMTRILVGILLPPELGLLFSAATGLQMRARPGPMGPATGLKMRGRPGPMGPATAPGPTGPAMGLKMGARPGPTGPAMAAGTQPQRGTMYACNHQTLLDPVILSTVLRRKVSAVTYSLSAFSELISPIPTVRLTRDRARDRAIMQSLLGRGDLVVCPEGTTCREPYLLRFSPLFAEVADRITPVAVRAKGTMFYGTTVRGYKWLDSFFFLMNPSPWYQLLFLAPVSGPSDGYDVANQIQRSIGCAIGFECTSLTRKDKYRMVAGHDGVDARTRRD